MELGYTNQSISTHMTSVAIKRFNVHACVFISTHTNYYCFKQICVFTRKLSSDETGTKIKEYCSEVS